MRTLEGSNRVRNGLMGIVILVLVVGVGQSMTSVPMIFASPTYFAQFKDTGGLKTGDKVQIAGVNVGVVRSEEIQGDKVVIGFGLGGKQIGNESRAAIRTDTILGRKNLSIENRGSQLLKVGQTLPLGQTTTPYQIYDAFFDVTKATSKWNIDTVKQSLNVLGDTIDQTYPHLSATLDGLKRFSDTIGKRDEEVKQLLSNANKIATILGDRSDQINRLLVNAKTLLAAVNARGQAITYLLERVDKFSAQVEGFINDNPNINRVLEQLRTISDILVQRKFDLVETLTTVAKFVASLGEAIASGPFFKVMLVNLVPYQILQPFVDAAFKKRGIDPEKFWTDARLPSFQWPDPNGVRQPNGAPAPAPTPLEGTPQFPGPAVGPGSPCSYRPPSDGVPTAGNPLPCAGLNQGLFPGPSIAPPDVATSAPNPNGPGYSPGIPIAGRPGETPPDYQGIPVPLPAAPPNGRTETGPTAGPYPPPTVYPTPLPSPAAPGPGFNLPPAETPPLPGNPPYLPPGAYEGTGT
jgi:phospholipid/cholesterol/gamma-HCH transport system substrate-binding protein